MKTAALALLLAVVVVATPAAGSYFPGVQDADPVKLFAFEIDPACSASDCIAPEDGAFYPGRATRDGTGFSGEPLQVPVGADVEFTNLSSEHHNIVSFKKIGRRPAFASDEHVTQGATSTMTTRLLKPGVYPFFCGHHPTTMFGLIEIVP